MKDYNNVKDNPDIEMGTIFRFDNYICEVDDYNQDNPNESIVFIYESEKKLDDGEYLEQVSLLNKDIKENIENYMMDKYNLSSVTRMSILLEMQDNINNDLLSYSSNYLMSEPRVGYEKEWKKALEKSNLIQVMLMEERNKDIIKKKNDIER